MAVKYVEEKVKKCVVCNKKTKHVRSNKKTSLLMILVHLCLIFLTAGIWLIAILIFMFLSIKIGGWNCDECGN